MSTPAIPPAGLPPGPSPSLPPRLDMAAFRVRLRVDLPRWVPATVRATAERVRTAAPHNAAPADRGTTLEVLALLQSRGDVFAAAFERALATALEADAQAPAEVADSGGLSLSLSLVDEDRIDEDIAIAALVKLIEAQAEWELSRLAALCSSLAGRDGIVPETNPLRPEVVARALRRCADEFPLGMPARLRLVREVGAALGQGMRDVYARQADVLNLWGVQPARYKVRATVAPPGTGASLPPATLATPAPGEAAPGRAAGGPLARLVQWARASDAPAQEAPIRLLGEAVPVGTETPLNAADAVRVMERLLSVLAQQTNLSDSVRQLLQRLDAPARELAATDADLWRSLDHPWWQLMDRVVRAGAVQDEATQPASVTAALDLVVQKLERATIPDAAQCRQALDDIEFAVSGLVDERGARIGPEAAALQAQLDRENVEARLREQVVQQLRSTPVPAGLRQFLVGPWIATLAEAALHHGEDSGEMQRHAGLVDDLIEACARPHRAQLVLGQLDDMQRRARQGLATTALAPARIELLLAELTQVLEKPGEPKREPDEPPIETSIGTPPTTDVIGLHQSLTTVPIDTVETPQVTPAAKDREAWLDGLEPGDYCRLFLLERWMTAQLTWRSVNHRMFVFSSRHAGGTHSVTRRALAKLRGAGLATTIERGQLIAQAMDTLTAELGGFG